MMSDGKRKKLISRRGDTLIEVLVSILLVTLTFTLLYTSVNRANMINNKIRNSNVSFVTNTAFPYDNGTQSVQTQTGLYVIATSGPESTELDKHIMAQKVKVQVHTVFSEESGERNDVYRYYERVTAGG